jgi:hypothetical protein
MMISVELLQKKAEIVASLKRQRKIARNALEDQAISAQIYFWQSL